MRLAAGLEPASFAPKYPQPTPPGNSLHRGTTEESFQQKLASWKEVTRFFTTGDNLRTHLSSRRTPVSKWRRPTEIPTRGNNQRQNGFSITSRSTCLLRHSGRIAGRSPQLLKESTHICSTLESRRSPRRRRLTNRDEIRPATGQALVEPFWPKHRI